MLLLFFILIFSSNSFVLTFLLLFLSALSFALVWLDTAAVAAGATSRNNGEGSSNLLCCCCLGSPSLRLAISLDERWSDKKYSPREFLLVKILSFYISSVYCNCLFPWDLWSSIEWSPGGAADAVAGAGGRFFWTTLSEFSSSLSSTSSTPCSSCSSSSSSS